MPNLFEQFILCPVCGGSGKNKLGLACANCGGMGLGVFCGNRFYYWGPKLGKAVIELDHLRKRVHNLILFFSYVISFFGVLSLGYWLYISSGNGFDPKSIFFWRERHYLLFIFWVSLYFLMFTIYQNSEDQRKRKKIEFSKTHNTTFPKKTPNNWEELTKAKNNYRIEVSHGYSEKCFNVIEEAFLLSLKMNHGSVFPEHILFAALADREVMAIFSRLDIMPEAILEKLKNHILELKQEDGKNDFSYHSKEILVSAYIEAMELGQKQVTPKNLLTSLVLNSEYLKELLLDLDITAEKIFNVVMWFNINDKLIDNYRNYRHKAHFKPKSNMNRSYTAIATPILDSFAYDLTVASKFGRLEFCVARNEKIESIFEAFESGKAGVILVGPPGVGKKTILAGIAERMVEEDVSKFLEDMRLVELDAARLISGANPAQAEGRLLAALNEVMMSGNIILCINNIEDIIGISSGEGGSMDLSEVLASALDRGSVFCIATATSDNYLKYIESSSFGDVMKKIEIEEPEGNQVIQIIESKIGPLEAKYKVFFTYNSIEKAINFSKKYIHDKYLPEKAIDVLKSVSVAVLNNKGEQSIVSNEDVARVVAEITKIPLTKISESESQALLHLEEKIHERMIGQHEAVDAVAASLRRARTELREGKKPIASFLFLGPTGVGKTELAKTISEVYFGNENYMIRIDMSEYQHPDSVNKMIGDASGLKGQLTEKVRQTPFSLILLDEMEKAHPDILDLFLQVMDDGRLTDGQGHTIDFTNSIIIATSNVGALYIQESIFKGVKIEEVKQVLINEHLNKFLRPEFINRFDGVIVFEPLSKENVFEISGILLGQVGKMLDSKGIGFVVDVSGQRVIANEGYDPKFGARPLKRVIQRKVEDMIANKILSNELKRRDIVHLNSDGEIEIEKGKKI